MAAPPAASPREIARSASRKLLDLVGDLLREVLEVAVRPGRRLGVVVVVSAHRPIVSLRRPVPRVTSSAYSRSPPTGSPLASRVTRKPIGRSSRVR